MWIEVQVNLFQKHSFLNQLTHNMIADCSLITDFSTRKIQVQNMLGTNIVLNAKTKTKNNFASDTDLPVLMLLYEQFYSIF